MHYRCIIQFQENVCHVRCVESHGINKARLEGGNSQAVHGLKLLRVLRALCGTGVRLIITLHLHRSSLHRSSLHRSSLHRSSLHHSSLHRSLSRHIRTMGLIAY